MRTPKFWMLFFSCLGCARSGNALTAVGNPLLNAAVGGGVAAYRRSQGECFTPCTPGNQCNQKTGYCEPIPCGGECPRASCVDGQCTGRGVDVFNENGGTPPSALPSPNLWPRLHTVPRDAGP